MAVNFPNASRAYDARRQCVTFWGHVDAFEVAFHLDADALRVLSPGVAPDEAALLNAFDQHRARIESVAARAWRSRGPTFVRLTATNF